MAKRKKKRLTKDQWREIQVRYESDDMVADIAAENGIVPSAISNRAKRHGWKRGSIPKAAVEAAKERVIDDLADEQTELLKGYVEGNSKRIEVCYKAFDNLLYVFSANMQKYALNTDKAIKEARAKREKMIAAEREKARARAAMHA